MQVAQLDSGVPAASSIRFICVLLWQPHGFQQLWLVQVAQLDSGAAAASSAGSEESTNMVDVAELMAAVVEDSPSNRLTMLQTSGMTSHT